MNEREISMFLHHFYLTSLTLIDNIILDDEKDKINTVQLHIAGKIKTNPNEKNNLKNNKYISILTVVTRRK